MREKYLINYNNKNDLKILRKLALYSSIYDKCVFIRETSTNKFDEFEISVFITHDLISLVKLKSIYQKFERVKFLILADGENMSVLSTLSEEKFIVLDINCKISVFKENVIYLNPKILNSINMTKREREILSLLLRGQNNNNIANQLGISERTIEAHRRNIYIKTGVHSITQLTLWAINNNMFNS